MEQKKHLRINCATCDISNAAESTLAAYQTIQINAALVLTSGKTQALVPKYGVFINAASVIEKPEDADLVTCNGQYAITAGDVLNRTVALLVNGALEIEKGTEEMLGHYAFIHVNGSVTYPQSLSGKLGMLRVNGNTECYPDEAIRLDASFTVDKMFRLRAKAGEYYARKRVILLDPAADPAALSDKGVRFLTKTAILAESLAEAAVPMFDDSTEIIIVPDGCAYVDGGAVLNEALLKKCGTKLYVVGDLVLEEESAKLFGQITYLTVRGDVQLPEKLMDAFSALKAEYNGLLAIRGKALRDKTSVTVDAGLLSRHPEGITLIDCVKVKLDEDIPPELIEEKLLIRDCVQVSCAKAQRTAVEMVSTDVVEISDDVAWEYNEEEAENNPDVQVINTSEFKLL